jgi:uncharacterized membrane protein
MKKQTALWSIFGISIAGMLFSGYLSYAELFQKACPVGGCSFVLGMPACVYGLMMYVALFVIAILGLKSKH